MSELPRDDPTDDAYFEIVIEVSETATGYAVEVEVDDPGSQAVRASARSLVAFDLEDLLARQADPCGYGEALTDQLLPPDTAVRQRVLEAVGHSERDGTVVRVVVRFKDVEERIEGLRWELLRHPQTRASLATSQRILLSRFMYSDDERRVELRRRGDLRALVAISAPTNARAKGLAPVDVEGEDARARAALESISESRTLGGPGDPCTLGRLVEELDRGVDILYLVCHGKLRDTRSALVLQDDAGCVNYIEGQDLAERIAELQRPPPLVVLASCESGGADGEGVHASFASALARAGVAAIVAMQGQITMATVREMMPTFFRELGRDGRLDRAMSVARGRVRDRPDVWMPALYSRLRDARLWLAAGAARRFEASDEGVVSAEELAYYVKRTRREYEAIPLLGFESALKLRVKLDDLCVALRTDIDPRVHWGNIRSNAQLEDEAQSPRMVESRTLAQALAWAEQHDLRGVVLLGDPGTGKTTFLRQALLATLEDPTTLGLCARTIPVFLPLRELGDERDLGRFIQAQLPGRDPKFAGDFGDRLVRRGELFLLFDGLDEIAEVEQRERAARWIESQLGNMRDSSYVLVSCRHTGYLTDVELDASFVELNLRHLDDAQMAQLVQNWYASVEDDGLIPKGEASARADALLEILKSPQFAGAQMYTMARNPLLLTGICWVHLRHGELGRARVKLFEQCIEALAKNWRKRCTDEGEPFPLADERQLETLLWPAAAMMHERRRRRVSFHDLREPVTNALEHHELKDVDADAFLRGARDHAGLLSGIGDHQLEFIHLGFQEFLAAAELVDAAHYGRLVERFDDSWWQEVVLLALGRPGAFEPFMDALVSHEAFARRASSKLMELCLTETVELSATPFETLLREGASFGWLRRWFERVFRRRRWSNLEQRQLAAARLMARKMPEALEGLEEVLTEHAHSSVRRWWRQHSLEAKLETRVVHGVELARIPAGRFTMGSPKDVGDDDERPQHEVELASFFLARTPVTNEQYERYLDANQDVDKPHYWADSRYNQPSQPVVGVSWHDAQRYCEWAGLVLPTEAQWEYACRAKTPTKYWSGDEERDLARVGWYLGNSERRLHPVAEKEPNAFGLYDVHGNVWEWCLDGAPSWGKFEPYTTSPQPGHGLRRQPVGAANRVVRGGSWANDADLARSAYRGNNVPGIRLVNVGFRPAQGIS